MPPDKEGLLPVSEIFFSIQGEGRFAGERAVFLRLGFCHLGCIWCDTRFTWDKNRLDTFNWLTASEIIAQMHTAIPPDTRSGGMHLVITGGEPLLHQDLIATFLATLKDYASPFHWFVEVETSGTIKPTTPLLDSVDWWNCSPKLPNNGRPMAENLKPEVLKHLLLRRNVDFKFVIQTEADLHDLDSYYSPLIPVERIILMPEGTTREQISSVSRWLIPEVARRGCRFSSRLHVIAWGNERGH